MDFEAGYARGLDRSYAAYGDGESNCEGVNRNMALTCGSIGHMTKDNSARARMSSSFGRGKKLREGLSVSIQHSDIHNPTQFRHTAKDHNHQHQRYAIRESELAVVHRPGQSVVLESGSGSPNTTKKKGGIKGKLTPNYSKAFLARLRKIEAMRAEAAERASKDPLNCRHSGAQLRAITKTELHDRHCMEAKLIDDAASAPAVAATTTAAAAATATTATAGRRSSSSSSSRSSSSSSSRRIAPTSFTRDLGLMSGGSRGRSRDSRGSTPHAPAPAAATTTTASPKTAVRRTRPLGVVPSSCSVASASVEHPGLHYAMLSTHRSHLDGSSGSTGNGTDNESRERGSGSTGEYIAAAKSQLCIDLDTSLQNTSAAAAAYRGESEEKESATIATTATSASGGVISNNVPSSQAGSQALRDAARSQRFKQKQQTTLIRAKGQEGKLSHRRKFRSAAAAPASLRINLGPAVAPAASSNSGGGGGASHANIGTTATTPTAKNTTTTYNSVGSNAPLGMGPSPFAGQTWLSTGSSNVAALGRLTAPPVPFCPKLRLVDSAHCTYMLRSARVCVFVSFAHTHTKSLSLSLSLSRTHIHPPSSTGTVNQDAVEKRDRQKNWKPAKHWNNIVKYQQLLMTQSFDGATGTDTTTISNTNSSSTNATATNNNNINNIAMSQEHQLQHEIHHAHYTKTQLTTQVQNKQNEQSQALYTKETESSAHHKQENAEEHSIEMEAHFKHQPHLRMHPHYKRHTNLHFAPHYLTTSAAAHHDDTLCSGFFLKNARKTLRRKKSESDGSAQVLTNTHASVDDAATATAAITTAGSATPTASTTASLNMSCISDHGATSPQNIDTNLELGLGGNSAVELTNGNSFVLSSDSESGGDESDVGGVGNDEISEASGSVPLTPRAAALMCTAAATALHEETVALAGCAGYIGSSGLDDEEGSDYINGGWLEDVEVEAVAKEEAAVEAEAEMAVAAKAAAAVLLDNERLRQQCEAQQAALEAMQVQLAALTASSSTAPALVAVEESAPALVAVVEVPAPAPEDAWMDAPVANSTNGTGKSSNNTNNIRGQSGNKKGKKKGKRK